jgi:coatomer subunit beta
LADKNELAALDVLVFIREVLQKLSNLKDLIVQRLLDICAQIRSVQVLRATLWLLGEYCSSIEDIQNVMTFIRQSLGELPIVDDEIRRAAGESKDEQDTSMTASVQRLVTADGTYATQSAFISSTKIDKRSTMGTANDRHRSPSLRSFLLDGDFFIGAALATSLCKLVIRYMNCEQDSTRQNRFCAEAMFIIASILHLGRTSLPSQMINEDDYDRMIMCIRLLNERLPVTFRIFEQECRTALADMLVIKLQEQKDLENKLSKGKVCNVTTRYVR